MGVGENRRILSIIVGILLALAGIYIYYHPLGVTFLIRIIGWIMLFSGLALIIEAANFSSSVVILRNCWIVDGVLMFIIGIVFILVGTFAPGLDMQLVHYTLTIWFLYTAVLQIWIVIKIPTSQLRVSSSGSYIKLFGRLLGVVLSVGIIILSVDSLFNRVIIDSLIAIQFVFWGVIKVLCAFVVE